ncbi:MAG: membrane protein insertion efficiency factor YidD [Candidatus Bipolaricaulota bacterium]|nr:membrane protein insertion efficiency factor YidD [Candidatus Bipolaricaulota bacterium]MBS3792231.1 membrane protein insertion efficiency factor YidD [Candidatus Bipolaricaulota bacterium]
MKILKLVLLKVIEVYQKAISPGLSDTCRFYPSCSEYSKQAIEEYGAIKGIYLAIKRVLRCHPLNSGGYDPIPKEEGEEEKS